MGKKSEEKISVRVIQIADEPWQGILLFLSEKSN